MQDEPAAGGSTSGDGQRGDGDGHVDAAPLIDAFGGIRPMASKLGVPVSTVQGWRERNAIPVARLDAVRAAAAKHDIALTPEHVVLQIGAPSDDEQPDPPDHEAPKPPPPRPAKPTGRWRDGGFPPIAGLAGVAFVVALVAMFLSVVATRQAREGAVVVAEDGAPLALANQLSDRMAALEDSGDSTATRVAVLEAMTAEDTELAAQVAVLTERLAAAETTLADGSGGEAGLPRDVADRLAALESAVAADRPTDDGASAVVADVEGLRRQDAAAAAAIAELAAGVDGLAGQVAALEARPRQAGSTAAAGVDPAAVAQGLAVMRLRQGLADGVPLDAALAMAARAFAGDAALLALVDDITAVVAEGVMSRAVLADDLGRLTVAPAAAVAGDGTGWLARAQARVANVVTVERTDGTDAVAATADVGAVGAGTAAALAEARQRLAMGDLAAAVDSVAAIVADGGEGADWLAAARHRLALETAVDALEAAVFDRLTAG